MSQKEEKTNDAEIDESSTKANSPAVTTDNKVNHNGKIVITGQWISAWCGSHQYRGWRPEGLNCFNKLVEIVKQDRDNDTHFQAQYEIWLNKSKCKKPKEKVKQLCVESILRFIFFGSLVFMNNIHLLL